MEFTRRFSCMLQADPIFLHSCKKDDLRFLAGDIQAYFDCIDGWARKLPKFLECASDSRNCEILPCSNGQKCAPQIRPNKKVHKIIFWSDQACTKTEIGFLQACKKSVFPKKAAGKPAENPSFIQQACGKPRSFYLGF